jgi:hypothetical protein
MARRRDLTVSLKRISSARRTTKNAAARALRRHYREHRRVKWGPLTTVLGQRQVLSIVFWGELEHRIGAVALVAMARRFIRAAITAIRRSPTVKKDNTNKVGKGRS